MSYCNVIFNDVTKTWNTNFVNIAPEKAWLGDYNTENRSSL